MYIADVYHPWLSLQLTLQFTEQNAYKKNIIIIIISVFNIQPLVRILEYHRVCIVAVLLREWLSLYAHTKHIVHTCNEQSGIIVDICSLTDLAREIDLIWRHNLWIAQFNLSLSLFLKCLFAKKNRRRKK